PAAPSRAEQGQSSTNADNKILPTLSNDIPSDRRVRFVDGRPSAAKPPRGAANSAVRVRTSFGKRQMAETQVPDDRVVRYHAALEEGVSRITYSAPYFDRLARGG